METFAENYFLGIFVLLIKYRGTFGTVFVFSQTYMGTGPLSLLNLKEREIMNNDFRKFATKKLGMNGLVLDDVVKAQQQYLNPYILEERQLNVTQMDVFSRLMMDRIIFLGTEIDDYTLSQQAWASTTPCSLSLPTWLPSAPVWQLPWRPSSLSPALRASAPHCLTAA